MIELKLTVSYKDTAISAKAIGGSSSIVLDLMDDLLKKLQNPKMTDFWKQMVNLPQETPKKPTQIMTAFDLENIEIADRMAANASKIQGKIYNIVGKNGKQQICNRCGGLISWDLRPERYLPLHCNKLGQIVGDGDCHASQ